MTSCEVEFANIGVLRELVLPYVFGVPKWLFQSYALPTLPAVHYLGVIETIYSIALRLRRQIIMNRTTTASTPDTIRTTIVVSTFIPPFGFDCYSRRSDGPPRGEFF